MAQIIEFPGPEGETLDMRLIELGADSIEHTTSSLTGKSNDKTLYRATDIADSLYGFYRVSAVDANGFVAFGGYVNLKGKDGEEHVADASYHLLKAKELKIFKLDLRPRYAYAG